MAVTRAQKQFVSRFIENDFRNATDAYLKAYPDASYDTARANSAALLTKTNIQNYLSSVIADILRREKLPLEKRIFDYWMRRAFYDLTEIIDLRGEVRLTEEELRERGLNVCIDSINQKTDANGNITVTYKFADKDRAAEMLQQYIQMIKQQPQEISLGGVFPVIALTGKEEADDGDATGQGGSEGEDNAAVEAPAETGEGAFQPGL